MIRIHYILLSVFCLTWGIQTMAQQEAHFSQYYYNSLLTNPAYAGYRETMDLTFAHRSQWVGFKGAPHSTLISANTPLSFMPNVSAGLTIMNDVIGPTHEMNISGDIAYRVRLSNRAYLSYGLKVSLGLYQVKLSDLDVTEEGDVLYANNAGAAIRPNFGGGVFYYKKKYYVGLSVPNFLKTRLTRDDSPFSELSTGTSDPTAYLTGGYLHKINRDLKILPSIAIKAQANAPLSAGGYLNFLFMDDQIKIGGYYFHQELAGALVQWQLTNQWRVGYSLDLPINNLITTSFGSHELLLNYQMKYKRRRIVYPRYF